MDVTFALHLLVPSARYEGSLTQNNKESYDRLIWLDKRVKPEWQELEKAFMDYKKVPIEISRRQAFLELESRGLLDDLEAFIATQPRIIQIEFQTAQSFNRNWPTLLQVAQLKNWPDEFVDDLFIEASQL